MTAEYEEQCRQEHIDAFVALCLPWRSRPELYPHQGIARLAAKTGYTIKAMLCLMLGRSAGEVDDAIEIASFNESAYSGNFDGQMWQTVHVGRGLLGNWHVSIESTMSL